MSAMPEVTPLDHALAEITRIERRLMANRDRAALQRFGDAVTRGGTGEHARLQTC
jgi:hypothetical protein